MEVLTFIIVLSVLILSHEFGHFIAAKRAGMRVDEFGLGFPPRLFSYKRKETRYSFNLIPFGGFVKIYGEEASNKKDGGSDPDEERRFTSKGTLIQSTVVLAGVFFNLLLAWFLFSAVFIIGAPTSVDLADGEKLHDIRVMVTNIISESPAEIAGLKLGDTINTLTYGKNVAEIKATEDAINFIGEVPEGELITINYNRGKLIFETEAAPARGVIDEDLAIGIAMETVGTLKYPIHESLWLGLIRTKDMTLLTIDGFFGTIKKALTGTATLDEIAGPVGIYQIVGDVSELGMVFLLGFTAVISINLAIINLFPFPALDGGRFLFILIEAIKGSPIRPQITNTINYVGFAILIFLMIIVTYGDLSRIGFLVK